MSGILRHNSKLSPFLGVSGLGGNADLFGLVFSKLHSEMCIYDNFIETESFGSEFLVLTKPVWVGNLQNWKKKPIL
jgi:hypothetical protein